MLKFLGWVLLAVVGFAAQAQTQTPLIYSHQGATQLWHNSESIQSQFFLESTNWGETWDTVRFEVDRLRASYGFLLDFNRPSSIVFASDSTWVLPGFDGTFSYTGALLVSKDRGRHWTYVSLPPEIKTLDRERVHFSDQDHGVVFSGEHYAVSNDGGYTWMLKKLPIKDFRWPGRIAWIDRQHGTIAAHDGQAFSIDGGQTWQKELSTENALTQTELLMALQRVRLEMLCDSSFSPVIVQTIGPGSFAKKKDFVVIQYPRQDIQKRLYLEPIVANYAEPGTGAILLKEGDEIRAELPVQFKPGQVSVVRIDRSQTPISITLLDQESREVSQALQEWILLN